MTLKEKMTALANAIRAKTGVTQPLTLDDMAREVAGITVTATPPPLKSKALGRLPQVHRGVSVGTLAVVVQSEAVGKS